MNRSTRPSRPGLTGSASKSLLLSAAAGGVVLKAEPDTTTSTSLAWNEPEYKPDNYRVERSLDGTTFSTVTTLANTVFTYTDTGRTESTQYWYRIVPILGGDDQPASNVADTWTVPDTPTGLTATAISSTQINLAWSDVSAGNTAQSIQRRSPAGSGSYSFIASVGATATSYNDTLLTPSTQYEYQVAATNPATQSAWSTAANATTAGGGPPASSWSLDFSTGEPWSNGSNYVFSSTASTTRTFVNSSGYVAPCVANLLLRSEDFTTTWTNTNTTEPTTNNTAPDGTATADEIKEAAATSASYSIQQSVSVTTGVTYTFSVYAKAGTATVLQLTAGSTQFGVNEWANFDLSAGVLGSVGSAVTGSDATIENIGSGWYRCKLTMACTATGTSSMIAAFTDNSTTAGRLATYTVTGGNEDSLYLWGAQLVTGSAALPYSATTTSSNGIPRLTHNSSGQRLGLLVEQQAANTAQYSEDFNNAYWTKTGLTTPLNNNGGAFYTSPGNTATALLMEQTAAAGTHRLERAFSATTDRVFSVFLKKQNLTTGTGRAGRYVTLVMRNNVTDYVHVTFDLDAGTQTQPTTGATIAGTAVYSNANAGIEAYKDDWYRVWITATRASGTTSFIVALATSGTPTMTSQGESYTGANATDGIYIWGAQNEARNAPPTSYIPVAAASTVTRQADLAYVEPGDVTNWGRPGSFVVEYYKPLQPSGGVVLAEDFGAGNPGRLGVEYSSGSPKIVYGTSGSGSGGTDTAGLNKIGWAWDGSGAATRSALNGSALDTSLATSFDPTLTDGISLGGNIDFLSIPPTVSGQPNVVIRRVRFWNSQLSAADLNTLTT